MKSTITLARKSLDNSIADIEKGADVNLLVGGKVVDANDEEVTIEITDVSSADMEEGICSECGEVECECEDEGKGEDHADYSKEPKPGGGGRLVIQVG